MFLPAEARDEWIRSRAEMHECLRTQWLDEIDARAHRSSAFGVTGSGRWNNVLGAQAEGDGLLDSSLKSFRLLRGSTP